MYIFTANEIVKFISELALDGQNQIVRIKRHNEDVVPPCHDVLSKKVFEYCEDRSLDDNPSIYSLSMKLENEEQLKEALRNIYNASTKIEHDKEPEQAYGNVSYILFIQNYDSADPILKTIVDEFVFGRWCYGKTGKVRRLQGSWVCVLDSSMDKELSDFPPPKADRILFMDVDYSSI